MKSTNGSNGGFKAMVAKVMTVGLLAGAFVLVAPTKAQAQGFGIGVQIGGPRYDYARQDSYDGGRRGYYDSGRRDYYEQERREIYRREAFERQREAPRQQDGQDRLHMPVAEASRRSKV